MIGRPWYQTLIKSSGWLLCGYLALGAVLDATGNAIALVTPRATYIGTASAAVAWIAIQLYLQRTPVRWVSSTGPDVRIRRLGWQPKFCLIGLLLLLWVPRFTGPERLLSGSIPRGESDATPIEEPDPNVPVRVTVLVADFAGADPSKFGVSEIIVEQLREATKDFPYIVVESLGRTVTAQEGPDIARQLGRERHASIVVSGWYAVNSRRVLVNAHCEILESPRTLSILKGRQVLDLETASFESFELQSELSDRMAYLVLLVLGAARLEAQDYDTEIAMLTEAEGLGTRPADVVRPEDLRLIRGSAYLSSSYRHPERLPLAIDDYSTAIRFNPTRGDAFTDRGVALALVKRYPEAINDFTKAIEFGPDRLAPAAYGNRAIARDEAGFHQAAIEDARHLVDTWPDQPRSHNILGTILLPDIEDKADGPHVSSVDDLNAASSAFSQAIRIDQFYAPGYANLAVISFIENNRREAIRLASRAIEIDPYNAAARNIRGWLYMDSQQRRADLAVADFTAIIERFPGGAYAYYSRGVAHILTGDHGRAREDLTTAIQVGADESDIRAAAESALGQLND